MKPLQNDIERLAFQVDRKILELDDEDYFRADLPAEGLFQIGIKMLPSPLQSMRTFVFTALALFVLLFAITNASSYSKIIKANIQDAFPEEVSATLSTVISDTDLNLVPENGIIPIELMPTTFEDRIRIPAINIDSRIVEPELGVEALVNGDWNALEDQIRDSLLKGVTHYPGTAGPGELGNYFLTGHSSNVFWQPSIYNSIFALLPRMKEGDDIFITHDQQEFHYRVTEMREVSPKNVEVLYQDTDRKMMTLMTCTPVGTLLNRLVVRAELIE